MRSWAARAACKAAVLIAAAACLAACGGPARSAADIAKDEPPTLEQSARDALEALATTAKQKQQLRELVEQLAGVLKRSGKARQAFTEELLKSLRLGRVNLATIAPVRADFEQAIHEATPDVLALLNELHAALTPAQRVKLVDGLAARAEAAEDKRKELNEEMIDILDIGFLQKLRIAKVMSEQLEPLRPAFEKMKSDAKAAGEAFKQDRFDATQLAIAKTDLGKLYLEGIVIFVGALAPELEPEQRAKLVGIIRYRLTAVDRRR